MEKTPGELFKDIASIYSSKCHIGIDKNKQVFVFIEDLDGLKKKKYLTDLTGRGETYQDACIDYIQKLLDRSICIRYKRKFYATSKIRKLINKTNFRKKYMNYAESDD